MSDTANTAQPEADSASAMAIARSGEPDRYLAALLSPPREREALLALAALSTELARVPLRTAHEPAMGEIRLQWWRDSMELPLPLRSGHPIADAVREVIQNYKLPASLIKALIDGRALVLGNTSPLSEDGQSDLLWKTEGALFALTARVVGLSDSREIDAGCAAAGQAYGLTRLLLELPQILALGRVALATPQLEAAGLSAEELLTGAADARIERLITVCSAQIRHNLGAARDFAASLPRAKRVAFLPLALVEPYLRALERSGRALLRQETRIAPLTRVCRIAGAHLFARL